LSLGQKDRFNDQDLATLLQNARQGLIYTLSPMHPLSELALAGLRAEADKRGLKLTLLTDSSLSERDFYVYQRKFPEIRKIASLELIYRGMLNHFPSLLAYRGGKLIGRPLLGAREAREIVTACESWFAATPLVEPNEAATLSVASSPLFGEFREQSSLYTKVRSFKFPRGQQVKFVRAIGDARYLLVFYVGKSHGVYLYDSLEEKVIRSWNGLNSPYASSDGKFALFMDSKNHLVFTDVFSSAASFFVESKIDAWYPAISLLENKGGSSRYRVLTRMREMKFQDYEIDFSTTPARVQRLGTEQRACTNLAVNATPYISKSHGDEFTLIEEDNNRRIVKMHPDLSCTTLTNFGFWTWKAGFSSDDRRVAFTAVRVNSQRGGVIGDFNELFVGQSYVYDRDARKLVTLSDGEQGRFSIPEFLSDGSVLVMRKDSSSNDTLGIVYRY
jgi:hypothetical protein